VRKEIYLYKYPHPYSYEILGLFLRHPVYRRTITTVITWWCKPSLERLLGLLQTFGEVNRLIYRQNSVEHNKCGLRCVIKYVSTNLAVSLAFLITF